MQEEGWNMVPRKDRPEPAVLAGYERKYEYDPDYTLYRRERGDWLFDHRREEEEKRDRGAQGGEYLPGHEPNEFLSQGQRFGFDPDTFDLDKIVRTVKSRPRH